MLAFQMVMEKFSDLLESLEKEIELEKIPDSYFYDTKRWPSFSKMNYLKHIANKKMGLPLKFNFEVSSVCNLKCEFCILKKGELRRKRRSKFMTFDTFNKIINEIDFFCTHIELTGGEPFLNKDIFKMLELSNKKFIKTVIATNGTLLSDDIIEKILENSPSELLIAFESGNEYSYEEHRKGGRFSKLFTNVENLVLKKKQYNLNYPKVCLQTVISKKTLPYLDSFWKISKDLGVDVACTKPLFIWPEGDQEYWQKMIDEYVPFDTPYSYYVKKESGHIEKTSIEGYCPNVQQVHIGTDGSVIPCWYNLIDTPIIGNALESGFLNLWFSSEYKIFREKMIKHSAFKHNCEYCIGIYKKELFIIKEFSED